jgi:hypothetical protein
MRSEHHHGDSFSDRLSAFLLVAYANGTNVEGQWSLPDEDPIMPDITVTVARNEENTIAPNGKDGASSACKRNDSPQFATQLETFLLCEYGDGTDISGMWTVVFARERIPSWTVEITLSECDIPLDSEAGTPVEHD